jgi:hypothetical protein
MVNTIVPKEYHVEAVASIAAAKWNIFECQKHLLVIDLAGKTLRLVSKPLRLKGKPQYKVPPDCDPRMW